MLVSHEHAAIFIHPPKTAGTAVRDVLQDDFGFRLIPEPLPWGIHSYQVPEQYAAFKIFGTIRNPYSRWVSWYEHIVRKSDHYLHQEMAVPIEFAEFTRTLLANGPAADLVPMSVMLKGAVAVVRQECLSDDFATMWFVPNRITMPVVNEFPHKPWREYYDSDLAALVATRYEKDFDCYGYQPVLD